MSRTFVAMSGGVDSSLAAALCVESGEKVEGVTMRLVPTSDDPANCGGQAAIDDARRVCDTLGIPHHVLDLRDVFQREVIDPFVRAYARGRTPNPCILCNDRVKFAELMMRVLSESDDVLVTGHYAQVAQSESGESWLARGADSFKDQSYFLYRLNSETLAQVRFPLGGMSKTEVRHLAHQWDLPTAHRSESQEICFVDDGATGQFVVDRAPNAGRAGAVVGLDGETLGMHEGVGRYTIGQRKGLAISGAGRRYVTAINVTDNEIVLGEHVDLAVRQVIADDMVWRGGDQVRVEAQIRYRMSPIGGVVERVGDELHITFDETLYGVAPGQAVVCYQGEKVLGGGVVSRTK